MLKIGLVVPVYKNFEGFAELANSVDHPVLPFVIPNWKENIGVSAGWNVGILKSIIAKCDFTVVCNDDVVLEKNTISKLIYAMCSDYDLMTPVNTRDKELTEFPEYQPEPDFSCFMIRPLEFTDKFGWFDEHFTPAYFEDCDMAYRMKLAGGKYACRTDAGMFHKGSVTQNWGGEKVVTDAMFIKNRNYYFEKWGGEPGYEKFTSRFGETA